MASTLQGINPALTTNAAGFFSVTEDGLVQGTALDDPAVRLQLAGGVWDPAATVVGYGGMGVYVNVPLSTAGTTTASDSFGGYVGPATSVTANAAGTLSGFMVFDQAINGIISPQTPVPQFASGMTINYYKLGSNARIAVQMAPSLVSLDGGIITPLVSWDYTNQQLVPYVAAYPANVLTGASWASTGGGQVTFTTTTNHGVAVGDYFTISGMTPAGYNGDFIAITGTATNSLVASLAVNPGSETVLGTLVAGGGALPCTVLKVKTTNCLTVNPSSFTWNSNGACAVIQI